MNALSIFVPVFQLLPPSIHSVKKKRTIALTSSQHKSARSSNIAHSADLFLFQRLCDYELNCKRVSSYTREYILKFRSNAAGDRHAAKDSSSCNVWCVPLPRTYQHEWHSDANSHHPFFRSSQVPPARCILHQSKHTYCYIHLSPLSCNFSILLSPITLISIARIRIDLMVNNQAMFLL